MVLSAVCSHMNLAIPGLHSSPSAHSSPGSVLLLLLCGNRLRFTKLIAFGNNTQSDANSTVSVQISKVSKLRECRKLSIFTYYFIL